MDHLYLTAFITLLLSCVISKGIEACSNSTATCCSPTAPTEDAGSIRQITDSQTSYNVDEVVGYFCENGNGHLSIKCKGNDEWTSVERNCEDRVPFSYASLAGMLFAIFNICLEITFISVATHEKKKREKKEEIEMRVMETAEATKA